MVDAKTSSSAPPPLWPPSCLFRGVSTRAAADAAMVNGLRPASSGSGRGWLAPLPGRTYITSKVHTAVAEAFGKPFAGRSRAWDNEPSGYILVLGASVLAGRDVQPAEVEVGRFVARHTRVSRRPFGNTQDLFTASHHYAAPLAKAEPEREAVWQHIMRHPRLTPVLREQILAGYERASIRLGKLVLPDMPIWMKAKMMEWGADLAVLGPVKVLECWTFPKAACLAVHPSQIDLAAVGRKLPERTFCLDSQPEVAPLDLPPPAF